MIARGLPLVLFAAAACSSAGNSPADAGMGDVAVVGCANQGDNYAAGMSKPGTMGMYTFTLMQASPAPPTINTNAWTMRIVDSSGNPPAASALTAVPFMPLMGHGTGQVPQFSANADGSFDVSDIYLFMNGLWTVTFTVTAAPTEDGGAPVKEDTAVFAFCING